MVHKAVKTVPLGTEVMWKRKILEEEKRERREGIKEREMKGRR